MGTCFYMFEQQQKNKNKNQNFIYKIHGKLWGDEINSLICIFIDSSQSVSLKITKIQTFISSLLFIWFTSNFYCSIRNVLLFLLIMCKTRMSAIEVISATSCNIILIFYLVKANKISFTLLWQKMGLFVGTMLFPYTFSDIFIKQLT